MNFGFQCFFTRGQLSVYVKLIKCIYYFLDEFVVRLQNVFSFHICVLSLETHLLNMKHCVSNILSVLVIDFRLEYSYRRHIECLGPYLYMCVQLCIELMGEQYCAFVWHGKLGSVK